MRDVYIIHQQENTMKTMTSQTSRAGYTIVEMMVFVIAILAAGGWITNIVKLTNSSFDPIEAEVILRIVGIFLGPLGAVMGFI